MLYSAVVIILIHIITVHFHIDNHFIYYNSLLFQKMDYDAKMTRIQKMLDEVKVESSFDKEDEKCFSL